MSLEKRMYFLVPYNISPIQQAIQAGHAALEYAYQYKDDPEYIDFIENHKTWIILNGGTTNTNVDKEGRSIGTLNQIVDDIIGYNVLHPEDPIKFSTFYEPDLELALTAICLVVDERVFGKEYPYPTFGRWVEDNEDEIEHYCWGVEQQIDEYMKEMGIDYKTHFLRELLNDKKLA